MTLTGLIVKAQSSIWFAALLMVAVGSFLIMGRYMKRSMQGSIKSAADYIGEQVGDVERQIGGGSVKHSSQTIIQKFRDRTITKARGDDRVSDYHRHGGLGEEVWRHGQDPDDMLRGPNKMRLP